MNLKKFFAPLSIAVVGASSEEGKIGNILAKNVLELGYKGEIFLVNPKHEELLGRKCYKSLAEIEKEVDLALIAIPAKFVADEIEKNAEKIKNYVIISAGFSETGEAGKELENKILALAEKNNLNILGPNCLGFIIPGIKLNASFGSGMPEAGGISFISQSGALMAAFIDIAKAEKIKFSNLISIGNKMQIDESELLKFLAEDENTKAVGFYLESIKNGEKFIEAMQNFSKIKPVVILKAGKNEKTQKAISSHTGALAGSDEIISAVLKKTGAIRAENLEEFFGILNLINNPIKNFGRKAVVITNAGGEGVLTADAFNNKFIQLADIDSEVKNELKNNLPAESSTENPIDLLGDAKEDRYAKALEIISKDKEIESIICLLTPQDQTPAEKIAEEIIKFRNNSDKTIVTVFTGGERVAAGVKKLKDNNVCCFEFPDLAISVLDKYAKWNFFRKEKNNFIKQEINEKRKLAAVEIISKAKKEKRSALYFSEAKKIMDLYEINSVECEEIFPENNSFEAKIKFPLVLKVDDDKILHKTDKNGLILNIQNQKELNEAIMKMQNNFPNAKLIIQPMAERGTELIVGVKRDEVFGPVVVYGLGGIYTEILKMVDYLVPPMSILQVEESLLNGKLKFLFEGARGQKKYDIRKTAEILLGIIFMSLEIPEIREFDINPLIMYNDEKKAVAVDVKIII